MRGKSRLSVLLIFVSVAGGVFLFKPIGLLYGPLALSMAFVLFQVLLDAQEEKIKIETWGNMIVYLSVQDICKARS
jgi:predicted PurR-regulated permease PerM